MADQGQMERRAVGRGCHPTREGKPLKSGPGLESWPPVPSLRDILSGLSASILFYKTGESRQEQGPFKTPCSLKSERLRHCKNDTEAEVHTGRQATDSRKLNNPD